MKVKLLVFANSKKLGGRCLAGIDIETRRWMRPVSKAPLRQIQDSTTCKDGRWIRPGDLIEIETESPVPLDHHPEDIGFSGEVTVIRKSALLDFSQLIVCELAKKNQLLETTGDHFTKKEIDENPVSNSLAIALAINIYFYTNHYKRRRVAFESPVGTKWDLAQTDDKLESLDAISEGIVCISLGEYFDVNFGSYYKLASGIIPITKSDLESDFHQLLQVASHFTDAVICIQADDRLRNRIWFWQTQVSLACIECASPKLEVFRSHEVVEAGIGNRSLHRYALLCTQCNYIFTTPVDNDGFRRELNKTVEHQNPVLRVCSQCS
jgi:hypothetical protein